MGQYRVSLKDRGQNRGSLKDTGQDTRMGSGASKDTASSPNEKTVASGLGINSKALKEVKEEKVAVPIMKPIHVLHESINPESIAVT